MTTLDLLMADPEDESAWTNSGEQTYVARYMNTDPWVSGSGTINLPGDFGEITIGGGTGQPRPVIVGGGGYPGYPSGPRYSTPVTSYLLLGILVIAAVWVLKK